MKKKEGMIIIIFGVLVLSLVWLYAAKNIQKASDEIPKNSNEECQAEIKTEDFPQKQNPEKEWQSPLNGSERRIAKKSFGTFVTPQNSPVSPERFFGYHTGTDFEIFPEELEADVFVRAVCHGKIVGKSWAQGYGGVAVEECTLDGAPVTVVYGHLKLDSISKKEGENWNVGEVIGVLGRDKSAETNGERKHLHLSIHKGSEINLLGYVQSEELLNSWVDPASLIFD